MKTIKKAQTGAKVKKPTTEKPKIAPKKPKTVSQRIGDTTLRDIKNASEDGLQLATLGVYGKVKKALGGEYKYKKIGEKKYGGKVTKAKNGKSFPDLNKDGKITKADILKGRGVIAKRGASIKKAQMGSIVNKKVGNYEPTKENIDRGFNNKSIKSKDKDYKVKVKVKNDGSIKATERRTLKGFLTGAPKAGGKLMKSGGSMKKCRYGCK
jgi:adenine-specific DNA methylase